MDLFYGVALAYLALKGEFFCTAGLFDALEFYLKESSSVELEVESSPEGLHLLLPGL